MTLRVFYQDYYEVHTGYEPSIGSYTLEIWDKSVSPTPIYTWRKRRDPTMTLEDIREILGYFGLSMPSNLAQDLLGDSKHDAGNLRVYYRPNGRKETAFSFGR